MGSDYTVVINIKTNNHMNFFNTLWSLYECNPEPEKIIIVCENYTSKLEPIFELDDMKDFDVYKYRSNDYDNNDDYIINLIWKTLTTNHVLFLHDKVVITDPEILKKCKSFHTDAKKYLEGYGCYSHKKDVFEQYSYETLIDFLRPL